MRTCHLYVKVKLYGFYPFVAEPTYRIQLPDFFFWQLQSEAGLVFFILFIYFLEEGVGGQGMGVAGATGRHCPISCFIGAIVSA